MVTRVRIGKCAFDPVSLDESARQIMLHLASSAPEVWQHACLNAGKLALAEKSLALSQILNDCELINADGMSIVWAARLLGYRVPERVTGIDLALELLNRMQGTDHSVFLLGGSEQVIEVAATELLNRFPGLQLAGYRNGYWDAASEDAVVAAVHHSGADLLLLGFPSPKKEFFAAAHKDELGVRVIFGVGGTFDVLAGKTRRAPSWMQQSGLEWVFRLLQEPRRMIRRYAAGNFTFVRVVTTQAIHRMQERTPK